FVDRLPAQTWSEGRLGVQYTVDSIESVQVQRSDYPAEYGRFTGGVINIKTKSGADGYNGGGRFFLGNGSVGANNPVDEQRDIAPNGSSFNLQGAFGGPIVKDKLWFMGSFRNDSRTDERRLSDTQTPYDADAADWGAQACFNYGLADTFRFKGFYSLNGGSRSQGA